MNQKLRCEKALVGDIPRLCELLATLFAQEAEFSCDDTLQKQGLMQILQDDKIGEIFICRQDGKIIAMVSLLYSISTALGGKVATLEDMVVDNEYQGQGVGNTLLQYAISYASSIGVKRITLLTDSDNIKAHGFYTKNGFCKSSMIAFRLFLHNGSV